MEHLTPIYIANFWMKVKEDPNSKLLRDANKWYGKCWIWHGSFFKSGYGRFYIHQKCYRAHRVSYYIYHGKMPNEMLICHRCDNPACVNPLHLFEGSTNDNTQDMIKKDRLRNVRDKKQENTSSKYFGVFYRKDNKKWRARYTYYYKNFLIGEFDSEIDAAKAYDFAMIKLNKSLPDRKKRPLNFP